MPSYCSFLVFEPSQVELVESICGLAGWNVRFITDPSKRYRFWQGGHVEVVHPKDLDGRGALRKDESPGKLLVVDADETAANNIIRLIRAAAVILRGFPDQKYGDPPGFIIPDDEGHRASVFENIFRSTGYFECFSHEIERPVAVALAATAWPHMRAVYAIHKLAASYNVEAVTPWSTHPGHGQAFDKHSNEFSDHVRTSNAINLAFSAIEELNLQVKSNKEMPRWVDKPKFVWNPKVLENLKAELRLAGIDPESTINWVARGDETEFQIEPARENPSGYADGKMVRDREFSLPDAIHACSYLRNYMTAHAFAAGMRRLGPYEVFNVQQVARFLILSKCDLWNVWTRGLAAWVGDRVEL